jgi:hypothetical protein
MSLLDAVDTSVWLSHLLDELKVHWQYVTYRSSAFNESYGREEVESRHCCSERKC